MANRDTTGFTQDKPTPLPPVMENQWLSDHKAALPRSSATAVPAGAKPQDMKYNLPPHLWSLPINQTALNSNADKGASIVDHSTRRAIMWCYGYTSIDSKNGYQFKTTASANPQDVSPVTSGPLDTSWGFQFLWNPESIGNSLSRNANFTPTAADKTAQFFGLFTAMEGLSFKIVIDRVNDFACIKSSKNDENTSTASYLQTIAETYYKNTGYPSNVKENVVDQLRALQKLGTMADIEYIFKMINGQGTSGAIWRNALGRATADIGFLAPTVVAVQFGPNADSLSYVGYVDGITITHNMFTEDMIPIHSEVNVQYVSFARTALAQA